MTFNNLNIRHINNKKTFSSFSCRYKLQEDEYPLETFLALNIFLLTLSFKVFSSFMNRINLCQLYVTEHDSYTGYFNELCNSFNNYQIFLKRRMKFSTSN